MRLLKYKNCLVAGTSVHLEKQGYGQAFPMPCKKVWYSCNITSFSYTESSPVDYLTRLSIFQNLILCLFGGQIQLTNNTFLFHHVVCYWRMYHNVCFKCMRSYTLKKNIYIYSDTRGITNTENTFTFKVFTVKNTV